MQKHNLMILGLVLITSSFLIGFVVLKQQAQDKFASQKDDATPVQLGQMTEQQKKHSKLYTRPEDDSGRDLLAKGKDIDVIVTAPWVEAYTEGQTKPSQETLIHKLTCDSDVIVQAKVLSKTSQLTEDRRFVFTDYSLELKEIIKSLPTPKLGTDVDIILTTPGGTVKVEGKRINVKVKTAKRLVIGDTYLFFLDFLADSDSFKVINGEGVFGISDNEVNRFSDIDPPYQVVSQSKINFIGSIRTASQMCKEK